LEASRGLMTCHEKKKFRRFFLKPSGTEIYYGQFGKNRP
jgi:hypothetical protein